jgi:hypothetical protein
LGGRSGAASISAWFRISAWFGISASFGTETDASHAEIRLASHEPSFWGQLVALSATDGPEDTIGAEKGVRVAALARTVSRAVGPPPPANFLPVAGNLSPDDR